MTPSSEYLHCLFNLDGRIAVVTGGCGRLGAEFVNTLASAGARVVIFDASSEIPDALTRLVADRRVSFYQVDVTVEDDVRRAFEAVRGQWGVPSILVNNVGWRSSPNSPGAGGAPSESYSMDVWDEVFRVNTRSAAVCSKLFGGMLIGADRPGVIINILSIYAVVAPDQRIYAYRSERGLPPFVKDASYSASKAALLGLTRDLAVQWAPHGIRVVALSPGGVEHGGSDPEFVKRYSERVPLGRLARTEDLRGALIFLASDASAYVNGINLLVDGGMSIW